MAPPEIDPGEKLDQAVREYVASQGDQFLTGYYLIATHENMESDETVTYSLASLAGQSHVTTLGLIHAGLRLHDEAMFGDPDETRR